VSGLKCRFCGALLEHTFVDLGTSPLANAYVRADALAKPESFYPLHVRVCSDCLLVQLPAVETPEHIFSDYAYFSSWSTSWLEHAQSYAELARQRFALGPSSRVVEVASNDGYLLQYFREVGVPVLGIEPAANVAQRAMERGVETVVEFFGSRLAEALTAQRGRADLVIGNNVLAHVPALNDFVDGLRIMLTPGGAITLEFPHLLRLIEERQFDTIYHEHFSYFSLMTVEQVFRAHDLLLFDVDELPTHGGSLRVYVRHAGDGGPGRSHAVDDVLVRESAAGLDRLETYVGFAEQVREAKRGLLAFLIEAKREGKQIAGYGAPAKGNTLLNYCGIGTDFLDFTVDRSTDKQGLYLPGTRIPILSPAALADARPDYVLVLPWNLQDEIVESMAHVRDWGGQFVVPIPTVRVL
jgi:SAM-dependent methyltransferase